ncbi:MAG: type I-C CRISPR-associated protein Cas7/Csd2 [Alphaproteobacteria bacterium]|nr:type I-C CRISPR-associated protein Cas7/Csd2 [Alphaproteobacteria bacterium]
MSAIQNRYEFVYLFDVSNGNPNGDPDAGNLPRVDPETGQGLVTDVCLKRKVRNFVALNSNGSDGRNIYVTENAILNDQHRQAYRAVRPASKDVETNKKLSPQSDEEAQNLTRWMCANFYDVRTFGAVMSTGVNCGQVRGPIQLTFACSVEPIMPLEISITRMAATNEAEKKSKQEGSDERTDNRTMGRKHIVPYGLYRAHGFVNAKLAERTGFGEEDLTLFWSALQSMFEHDRSAARGEMSARKLTAFKHASALGNEHAHKLFDRVTVKRVHDGETFDIGDKRLHNARPARAFTDYRVGVNRNDLPPGVEIVELI